MTTGLLQALLAELQQLEGGSGLGFLGEYPQDFKTRIYCNRTGSSELWYTRENDQNHGIKAKAIRGYATGLSFDKEVRYEEEKWLMHLDIDVGDRAYQLEAAHGSTFAKGLLVALATMTPYQLKEPITIGVQPGDQGKNADKVLLARVWSKDGYVINKDLDWETIDWKAIAKTARENVAIAVEERQL